jgi:hypothetical protein
MRIKMKKYILLLAVIMPLLIYNHSFAQNYFPLNIGDELQERDYSHYYDNFGYSWTTDNYPSFNILDSIIYNNIVFYKYKSKYFAYDSTDQKLFIYISGTSHLAVDFNLPANSMQVLYYSGEPRIWKSGGISYQNILGSLRKVFTMSADTTYDQGPRRYVKSWIIKIAEDIGPHYDYYYQYDTDLMYEEARLTSIKTIIFAKIDTNNIDFYNQSIHLAEPVRDRYLSEFPYILSLNITNPITGLISEFYADYNIIRNDTLISSKVFDIDTSTFLGFINIQPEELQAGDKIKFKCTLKDTSIFNNVRVTPDSGYYIFYVLPDTFTSVNTEFNKIYTYSLSQNFPNPFKPSTIIQYKIPAKEYVSLKIYDVLGVEVATLVNEEKPAGNYSIEFNGSNLASGIYFYQLKSDGYAATKKLILLK